MRFIGYRAGVAMVMLASAGLASQGLAAELPKAGSTAVAKGVPTTRANVPQGQLPPYTKLQYDSMLSVNDRCAVRRGHLNPNIRPVYVNRQPVGFC